MTLKKRRASAADADDALRLVASQTCALQPIAVLPFAGSFEQEAQSEVKSPSTVNGTVPVWATVRNRLGLHGTAGNVSEWHDELESATQSWRAPRQMVWQKLADWSDTLPPVAPLSVATTPVEACAS